MAAILSATSVIASVMPAQAGELTAWGYNSQTRSINVVLPDSVAPIISVIAPNQLLLELPDTQIGDVAGKTVGDGVVEKIVLEQATPETVWMVVDFATGTVLANVQSATQTTLASANMRQWEIRPALLSIDQSAAANDPVLSEVPTSAADSLQMLPVQISQSPEFPELPVLEPAMPIDESISVPSLAEARSVESIPIPVQPPVGIEANRADMTYPLEASPPEAELPIVEAAPAVEAMPVVERRETEGNVNEDLPSEPTFLEELGNHDEPREPVVTIPAAREPVPRRADDVSPVETTVPEAATIESVPLLEILAQDESATPVNRWPEPVPFGQPLP